MAIPSVIAGLLALGAANLAFAADGGMTVPGHKPARDFIGPPMPDGLREKTKDDAVCFAQLALAHVKFEKVPAAYAVASACGVANGVRLAAMSVNGSEVTFPDKPLLNCAFALTFARWVTLSAAPAISQAAGSPTSAIATGPGYECRSRNGDSSAKLSEHAFGNAVDVTTIKTAGGGEIAIADALNPYAKNRALIAALRASACGAFTTVLGPGSNEAHRTHFHFDLGKHGTKGTYRICE